MKTNKIILPIDTLNSIVISFDTFIENLVEESQVTIKLSTPVTNYYLCKNGLAFLYLDNFLAQINLVLTHQVQLPQHITSSLGYVWNNFLYLCSQHAKCNSYCSRLRALIKYSLSSAPKCGDSWLYNKGTGYFFESNPNYFALANETDPLISYADFIKTYQPYLMKKISKKNLLLWKAKINFLQKIMKKNEKIFYEFSSHKKGKVIEQ